MKDYGPSSRLGYRVEAEKGQWVAFCANWGSRKYHGQIVVAGIAEEGRGAEIPAPRFQTCHYSLNNARWVSIEHMRGYLMERAEAWDVPELEGDSELRILIRYLKDAQSLPERNRTTEPTLRERVHNVLEQEISPEAKLQAIRQIVGKPFWKQPPRFHF